MKKYHWQPELSMTIIYWSATFAILFIGLILTLENTKPYLTGNFVIFLFFLFFLLGWNRYFHLHENTIVIHALLPCKRKKVHISAIQQIRVGTKSIELSYQNEQTHKHIYMMTQKKKQLFVEKIETHPNFSGEIIYDDQLKMGNH